MTLHRNYGLWLALLATLLISACGIKPGRLEQPPGTDKNDFPRDYPQTP
jgi:predicted small lipoprotein YifL